jgi:hypothetical protein
MHSVKEANIEDGVRRELLIQYPYLLGCATLEGASLTVQTNNDQQVGVSDTL